VEKIWVTIVAVTKDKTKISAYVTKALQQQLKLKADEIGLSTSQLLGRIVAEYLGELPAEHSGDSSVYDQIQELQAALTDLGKRTDNRLEELSRCLSRIDDLEQEMQSLIFLDRQQSEVEPASGSCQLATSDITVTTLPDPVSGRDLAKRLGSSPSTISIESRQGRDYFVAWSAKRDPDSFGWWRERPAEKLFKPVQL
jgi:hypothetical protein